VAGGVVTGGVVTGGVVAGGVVGVGVAVGLVDGVGDAVAVGLDVGLAVGLVDNVAGGGPMQVSVIVYEPSGATGAEMGLSQSTVGSGVSIELVAYPAVAPPANQITEAATISGRMMAVRRYQGSGASCRGAMVRKFLPALRLGMCSV
jgi:hypothetical protein